MKNNYKSALRQLLLSVIFFTICPTLVIPQQQDRTEYVVGPGDVLSIQVWDNDDLNREVEVSHDGSFTFPFVGKIKAMNLSVFRIEKLLTEELSAGYLVSPQVSISIAEYRNKKVFLFGEIVRPGSYILKKSNHLLELISEAGGFTAQRGTTCIIVRPKTQSDHEQPHAIEDAQKGEIIRINLDKLISGENEANAFYIQPGDTIYVVESAKIYVTGEVRSPGQLNWKNGLTVREAVSLAGGGTPRSAVRRIKIIRKQDGVETTIKPSLGDLVHPNDIIKVPESYF